jgi:hypothetical protein
LERYIGVDHFVSHCIGPAQRILLFSAVLL